MIYKVFYQNNPNQSPRREQTQAIYIEIDAQNELDGRIQARQLIEDKTNFRVEYIELLSEKHLAYEKETGVFELTEL